MKRFIHRENLKLLRDQLARTTDEAKCQRILRLIEEEELKDRASADDQTQRRGSKTLNDARNAPRLTH
ncbi:MAG: hypothetical protein P4M02_08845 [Clostridia bacterium]|nr:hypothetical protein [Clostridia bacterium]